MDIPEYEFANELYTDVNENCPIRIKTGQYKDIIFKFGKIQFEEKGEDLNVIMDIDVLVSPDSFDKSEQEFTNTVGLIFTHIVESGVETKPDKKPDPVDLEDDVHAD